MKTIVEFRLGQGGVFAPILNGEVIAVKYGVDAQRDAFIVDSSDGLQLHDAASGMLLNHNLRAWGEMNGLSLSEINDFTNLANQYMQKRTDGWRTSGELIEALNSCPVVNLKPYKIVRMVREQDLAPEMRSETGIYDDSEIRLGAQTNLSGASHSTNIQSEHQLDFFSQFGM